MSAILKLKNPDGTPHLGIPFTFHKFMTEAQIQHEVFELVSGQKDLKYKYTTMWAIISQEYTFIIATWDQAQENNTIYEKAKVKEKLVIGLRWSGSSGLAGAIGDDKVQLKVQPTGNHPTSLVLSLSGDTLATHGFWDSTQGSKDKCSVL
ncbi:hypothetical protein FRC11_001655, partial [Ceratobasidium sp. 423]